MITMYDSIDVSQIPANPFAVAGYTSGHWPTYPKLVTAFPNAHHLSIAVSASHDADCLDIETGDATVASAAGWYARQKARGLARPVFYASASVMHDDLVPAMQAAGITRSSVRLWSAHYGTGSHVCGPDSCGQTQIAMDGTQYTDSAFGRDLDASLLLDSFFGAAPKPASTVTVWVAEGQKSLADLCAGDLHNAVSTVLRLTAEHSAGAIYTPAMSAHINEVAAADKAKVPAGVTVWYPKGSAVEAFTSHGTQTLQGLADTWKCEPSTVVRLTAEKSLNQQFTSGMAGYLNGVFSRSALHLPAGIHVYYQH